MAPGGGEAAKYRFEYYSPRPPYWSYDGLPFGGVYGATLAALLAYELRQEAVAWEHCVWCVLPACLHVVLFLATQWSVEARCLVRFRREADLLRASYVKVSRVSAESTKGKVHRVLLVPLVRQGGDASISYLKKKFVFNQESQTFERLRFCVTASLETYVNSNGLAQQQVADAMRKFGPNVYDIPLPTFSELFQEHAVAPFFVFQVFCVLLWLMDDYWYYSLLTLFMLIVLEAQMVHRRRSDLSELRGMRIPPRPVGVFRDSAWKSVMSDQLLPGDVVAVARKADVSFPCDVLLLQGSVLVNESMLTGESVPQMKSPELRAPLDMRGAHKQNVVLGVVEPIPSPISIEVSAGTSIMLHQNSSKAKNFKKVPFHGGAPAAVGYVLRTGFDTTQRVTVSSREALHFLMILLAFAVGACCYVLHDGLVVFPIMLSLAVNLSLVALVKRQIYCTEPFRVPLAGRVETCCFDKTGTLTSDSMEVDGVHGLEGSAPPERGEEGGGAAAFGQALPFLATAVMAACNSLTPIEGEVVGDPLEKAALGAVRWVAVSPDLVASRVGKGADRLQVVRRFPFQSELQRMAVVVRHTGPGTGYLQGADPGQRGELDRCMALVKGSCEALAPRLRSTPGGFAGLQRELTRSGFRVLCLAGKELPTELAKGDLETVDREEFERDLEFGGLLVLRNCVKQGTASTIRQLRKSYHRVVMITGDNPLTACQVAGHVSMADGDFLMLQPRDGAGGAGGGQLEWRSSGDAASEVRAFALGELRSVSREFALCVPGWALPHLSEEDLSTLAPFVTVFARVSPQQKEQVVQALNGHSHTMMVGDGTNDVGALKHAHVGISLFPGVPASVPAAGGPDARLQADLAGADGQAPIVRLGDASIASPFTYKGDSVKCCLHVLRCGRATLSTVLMMYKIMGLNSVMTAFAMSVLTLDGVKLGDGQTAVESLFTSMCFFLVSKSHPAKQLAKHQPISSVFAWPVLLSLGLQLVVHMAVLLKGWMMATALRPKDFKRDVEGDFEPNLTNTVVFQLVAAMHASSFLANYEGYPFMEPLSKNRALLYSLGLLVAVLFATVAELSTDLNESLSLVPAPSEDFRQQMLLLLAADIGLSVLLSRGVSAFALRLREQAAERRAVQLGLAAAGEAPAQTSKKDKKKKSQ
ncbi:unnamed protein product [Prorocentrum cordatum]|uniref:Cation-transporting ATPase n=1 Tax=Prorocentrum cordatum TaxID=2364126 RepID=A0ABN9SMF6_9DINO|nr:unnamed protein product [Polarella glacialis]